MYKKGLLVALSVVTALCLTACSGPKVSSKIDFTKTEEKSEKALAADWRTWEPDKDLITLNVLRYYDIPVEKSDKSTAGIDFIITYPWQELPKGITHAKDLWTIKLNDEFVGVQSELHCTDSLAKAIEEYDWYGSYYTKMYIYNNDVDNPIDLASSKIELLRNGEVYKTWDKLKVNTDLLPGQEGCMIMQLDEGTLILEADESVGRGVWHSDTSDYCLGGCAVRGYWIFDDPCMLLQDLGNLDWFRSKFHFETAEGEKIKPLLTGGTVKEFLGADHQVLKLEYRVDAPVDADNWRKISSMLYFPDGLILVYTSDSGEQVKRVLVEAQ